MNNLSLDELKTIRDCLNEKIFALVTKAESATNAGRQSRTYYATSYSLAVTRDKIQAEIDKRQKD